MFWNNGLGPVKSEWSINFTVVKGSGGAVTFVNEEYDFSFPFWLNDDDDADGETHRANDQFCRFAQQNHGEHLAGRGAAAHP